MTFHKIAVKRIYKFCYLLSENKKNAILGNKRKAEIKTFYTNIHHLIEMSTTF